MKILGKPIADRWLTELQKKIARLARAPRLGIVQVGDDRASTIYVQNKLRAAKKIGVEATLYALQGKTTTEKVMALVQRAVAKNHAVIIQLPLPKHIDRVRVLDQVPLEKDVDGLSRLSFGALLRNEESFLPATVLGILTLLKKQKIKLPGTRIAIVGMGLLVGRPLATALLNRGASVITIDRHDTKPQLLTRTADILIAATGSPHSITTKYVHSKMIVIDVGFSLVRGQVQGDVATDAIEPRVKAIVPVPAGVGPLTVAALLSNVYEAAQKAE
jgi:methylenetetrahydrofolate dehydrogenase (NADP+)/methenyltetrahydrofolate cyclohydrolase